MNFRERQVLTMWAGAFLVIVLLAIGWTGYQAWRMVGYWTGWW